MKRTFDLGLLSDYRTELMGIAAIMVVICHCLQPPSIYYHSEIIKWFLVQGNRGVDIFFFVSGLGLCISLGKLFRTKNSMPINKKIRRWYLRRFSRILPVYLALGLLYFVFEGIRNDTLTIPYLIGNITTVQYWFTGKGIWFIAALIPLYIVTPFYYLLFRRIDKKLVLTVFLVIICLLAGCYFRENTLRLLAKIPSFVIGFYMADLIMARKKINIYALFAAVVGLIVIIKVVFPAGTYYEWLFIFPIMLVAVACFRIPSVRKGANWCGKISLESYISNCVMISLMGLVSLDFLPDWLLYGNYFRYALIIIFGTLLAWGTSETISRIQKASNKSCLTSDTCK